MTTRWMMMACAAAVALSALLPRAAAAQAAQEGLTVHGHWVVEIRNPDGSVASRHEFQNALSNFGRGALSLVLSRNATLANWALYTNGDPRFCGPNGSLSCSIFEPGAPTAGVTPASQNLTVTLGTGATPATPLGSFSLSGSLVATANGAVHSFSSQVWVCGGPYLTACSGGATYNEFSQRTLPSPIGIQAGQQLQVTVTFTFS